MKKISILVGVALVVFVAYAAFLHARYAGPNRGELHRYTILVDCAISILPLTKRLAIVGPVSTTLACALRDKYKDQMGFGSMYVGRELPATFPQGTATELVLEIGAAACIEMRDEKERLADYIEVNMEILDWLLENYDHSEFTEAAARILSNKGDHMDVADRCTLYVGRVQDARSPRE